jgi:hypothetical protein
VVIAFTEYSSSSLPLAATASIALKAASTGPEPSARPASSAADRQRHLGARRLAGLRVEAGRHQAVMLGFGVTISSRISAVQVLVEDLMLLVGELLEAREGLVEVLLALDLDPSSCRRARKALRPECLPSTSLLAPQPTSSARMIS